MKIQEAYERWAETYDIDRNLTRDLDQAVTQDTLSERRYANVLEIGCGTGKNTPLLARLAEHVVALDFSAAMLRKAKLKAKSGAVAFVVADITQLWPVQDQSTDLVVCNLVLEHIENLPFIFAEAFRTLIPGGIFFVSELHPFRQYHGVQAHFQRGTETIKVPAFVHHVSDFLGAARAHGLSLKHLKESWHQSDEDGLPRLISFLFEKTSSSSALR